MTVVAVHAGRPRELPWDGGVVRTAFRKSAVDGPVRVSSHGLEGDEQADTVNHGGVDKAVCVYPAEHYDYWGERLGRELGPAAFGENLTVLGHTETDVCVGDVFTAGEVAFQVSQPRRPCFKIGAAHGLKPMTLWVQESGYTGYYLRVLSGGRIRAGDELTLAERPHPRVTVAEANRLMHRDKDDRTAIRAVLVPELSASWRSKFEQRLEG